MTSAGPVATATGPASASVPELFRTRSDKPRREWGSLFLLAPALALLILLFLIPVGYAFFLGLTNLQLIGPNAVYWGFTGMENVHRLFSDPTFYLSSWLTALFVVGSVVGCIVLGLLLALLIQRANAVLRVIVGGVVVIAWMMPAITAGMTWYASTTAGGTFATLFASPQADYLHTFPMLIVTMANIWSQTGFAMLVLGAALRNIPGEILEAAVMEGASPLYRFRKVTLPLLRPTMVTTVLLVSLISLANFALIYIMTQGGPGDSTNILPVYSYQQAFQFYNLGYGALIGNAMVIVSAIVGFIYVRAARVDR